jgi:hypothetical protein
MFGRRHEKSLTIFSKVPAPARGLYHLRLVKEVSGIDVKTAQFLVLGAASKTASPSMLLETIILRLITDTRFTRIDCGAEA